jgi:hypothetical protein
MRDKLMKFLRKVDEEAEQVAPSLPVQLGDVD